MTQARSGPSWRETDAIAHRGKPTLLPACAESCRYHDGKRCELLGFHTSGLCEPMIADWSEIIARLAAHSERSSHLHPKGKQ